MATRRRWVVVASRENATRGFVMDNLGKRSLGLLAALLTASCWLPQLRRSCCTRSISWTYLAVLTTGVCLWVLYWFYVRDIAVIGTNAAAAAALLTLAAIKASFDRPALAADCPTDPRPLTVNATSEHRWPG